MTRTWEVDYIADPNQDITLDDIRRMRVETFAQNHRLWRLLVSPRQYAYLLAEANPPPCQHLEGIYGLGMRIYGVDVHSSHNLQHTPPIWPTAAPPRPITTHSGWETPSSRIR